MLNKDENDMKNKASRQKHHLLADSVNKLWSYHSAWFQVAFIIIIVLIFLLVNLLLWLIYKLNFIIGMYV